MLAPQSVRGCFCLPRPLTQSVPLLELVYVCSSFRHMAAEAMAYGLPSIRIV